VKSYYGNLCSWFYDIDKPLSNKKELQFYLSFANKEMNILEPMCGSGRFLVNFIKNGFKIDGFDISSDMLKKCKTNIENDNILQCCNFENYFPNKECDLIFIPSGSFSLITNRNEIFETIRILEGLNKQNGKIVIELETNENIEKDMVTGMYSEKKIVKENDIEITFSQKIIEIDEKENVVYSICKYELYENKKYVKEEEEEFDIKYYKPTEFEEYIKGASLKIKNKYIDYEKRKYINQKTERIIYEINKK
jgi:ubiquinone/menaquinone biosynthesis C-methylase UbiE